MVAQTQWYKLSIFLIFYLDSKIELHLFLNPADCVQQQLQIAVPSSLCGEIQPVFIVGTGIHIPHLTLKGKETADSITVLKYRQSIMVKNYIIDFLYAVINWFWSSVYCIFYMNYCLCWRGCREFRSNKENLKSCTCYLIDMRECAEDSPWGRLTEPCVGMWGSWTMCRGQGHGWRQSHGLVSLRSYILAQSSAFLSVNWRNERRKRAVSGTQRGTKLNDEVVSCNNPSSIDLGFVILTEGQPERPGEKMEGPERMSQEPCVYITRSS